MQKTCHRLGFFWPVGVFEEREAVKKKRVLTSCQQLPVIGVDAAVGGIFSDEARPLFKCNGQNASLVDVFDNASKPRQ